MHTIEEHVNGAFAAAAKATADYLAKHGDGYPCGFAWVLVRPARGPLATYLKKNDLATKYYGKGGGLIVYNPSKNYTQSMYAKLEGARAFVNYLEEHGYTGLCPINRWD